MMFKPDDEFMAAYERAEEKELCHAEKDDDEDAAKKRRKKALAIGGLMGASAVTAAAITAAVTGKRGSTPAKSREGRSSGKVYRVSTEKAGLRDGQRAQYERAGLKVGATYHAKAAVSKPHPEYRYTTTKPRLSEEERAEQFAKKTNYKPKIRRKK